MKKIVLSLSLVTALTAILFVACTKENSDKPTTVRVRMTDNPVNAEEVNVDLQQVMVKFRDDSASGWATLNTNARIYNLLGLQNGVDTLIASGEIPTNTVKEIRLILGSNNTIKVNGVVYPLTIPSGSESGLKIKVNKTASGPLETLLIDFDAALSVHQTGNGSYQLKPVIKLK